MTQTIAQQLNVKDFPFEIKDKDGNCIYWENSRGNWSKREYDSRENCIYFETSDGYWWKSEFDSNGNEIYFESSNGHIVDNRPQSPCDGKVVEIDGKKYKLTQI